MTSLPECQWREPREPAPGEKVKCTSAKVNCRAPFDPVTVCAGQCTFPNHAPCERRTHAPCKHLGEEVRRVECKTCNKRVELKVFACAVHGECVLGKKVEGVKSCPCLDYAPRLKNVIVPQPPPLEITPKSHLALVTLAVGPEGERLFSVSEPYMRAYAERVGADFHVLRWSGHPDWPMSAKFGIPRALDHYARIAYVDADVLLRPGCVNLFELCASDEFGAVDELPYHKAQPQHLLESMYREFRAAHGFAEVPAPPFYVNCGVMVVPKRYRDLLLPPTYPLPVHHLSEQHHTNARVLDGYLAGDVRVRFLDRRANHQNWTDYGFKFAPPDAVLHFSGGGRERKKRHETMAALAPPLTLTEATAELAEPVMPATTEAGWCIDLRHLRWLHGVLMSGRFRRVLEIGCYHGFSTTAFLEALKAGKVQEVHLCEPNVTPELLRRLIDYDLRPTLHPCTSIELLAKDDRWDFVFVDGEHFAENVKDEARRLIAGGVPCVMAHDTCAAAVYPECDGPQHLKAAFQRAGYLCLEDAVRREEELTERGMFFAASDRDTYEVGRRYLTF